MSFPSSENFSKHSDNLRMVDKTLTQIKRLHKRAIRENDPAAIDSIQRIHVLQVGIRAEVVLRKIIEDPTGFNDRERRLIWQRRSQEDRWVTAVDLAARRHYGVPIHLEVDQVAPPMVVERIALLTELLRGELAPVITDRNKIAHGEWAWQLKSNKDDQFRSDQMKLDWNYVQIDSRNRLVKLISKAVHVLAVSEPTFDREFDKISKEVDQAKAQLDGSGYEDLVASLRATRRE